ncbi:MAG: prepilin-type N-terminal cleavage/methylation domain-containing protein [Phycisphaerales bacterium]|nr:prepilin-type N-terminal cleavage/methylation domain-containing protein [Phycisphaerales bacterium]
MSTARVHPVARGFTLVEVIVAVTIMALLVSMVAMRISGTRDQQVSVTVDQLRDMLMMYAIRSEHAPEPVAISMDSNNMIIGLVRREPAAYEGGESQWNRDPVVPWVNLPEFMVPEDIEVLADGNWIDIVEWPLVAMPGENRPAIEINLNFDGRVISLQLSPHSLYATRHDSGITNSEVTPRDPVDLDQTGRWQEDW